MKIFFLIPFIGSVLLSCTSASNKVDSVDTNNKIEKEGNGDQNFTVEAVDLDKTGFFSSKSLYGAKEQSAFRAYFSLKNNTANVVTSFKIGAFVLLKFDDQNSEAIPYPNNDERINNLSDYKNEVPNKNSKSYVSPNKPWKVGQVKDFNFEIFKTWGFQWKEINFPNSWFQRTPKTAFLVYRYKAITVDKEYENEVYSDILQEWKDYQTKLGLR